MESRKLPNAVLIIILGILSIITCCFWGIGVILGLIALFLAIKATKIYKENPQGYDNYSNITIGKVLAIIGIVLSSLVLLYLIWILTTFGWEALQDPELLQERLREYFGQ